MKSINVAQMVSVTGGRLIKGPKDGSVSGVSIDSRTIKKGDVFFAVRGARFDGHHFVTAAIEKGASCLVVERAIELPAADRYAVIVVDDTVAALGRLAAWYRQQLSCKVIAITGSVGKTSTRQMMYEVLRRFYRCRQAPKSFNNLIGVSLSILSAEMEDEILLLELGANRSGEIAELTEIAKPDAAVITFIGPAHLEGFGTLGNVLNEKISIVRGLKKNGTLYINGDQPELKAKANAVFDGRIVTFGTTPECDIVGTDLHTSESTGHLAIDGQPAEIPLAGKANLMNTLTVWSVCKDLKVELSDYIDIIGRSRPASMRLEILETDTLTILNDCYNANPVSMVNALECLAGYGATGKRRLVFIAGFMAELGEQSQMLHREIGRRAAELGVGLLLCVGPFAKDIAAGAAQYNAEIQIHAFANTDLLCNNVHKNLRPDDIVLVKGSRAAGLEKAVEVILKCKI